MPGLKVRADRPLTARLELTELRYPARLDCSFVPWTCTSTCGPASATSWTRTSKPLTRPGPGQMPFIDTVLGRSTGAYGLARLEHGNREPYTSHPI